MENSIINGLAKLMGSDDCDISVPAAKLVLALTSPAKDVVVEFDEWYNSKHTSEYATVYIPDATVKIEYYAKNSDVAMLSTTKADNFRLGLKHWTVNSMDGDVLKLYCQYHTNDAYYELYHRLKLFGGKVLDEPEPAKFDEVESGVFRISGDKIVHKPTGIVVTCDTERSQHRNRNIAMRMLEEELNVSR